MILTRTMLRSCAIVPALAWSALSSADEGALTRAERLIHAKGTAEAVRPENARKTKAALFKALGKTRELTAEGVAGIMSPDAFRKLAGTDQRIDSDEVKAALETTSPASRRRLTPSVAAHAARLATSFDRIEPNHREAAEELADWIAKHYQPGKPLSITFICTANSRRSFLGETMGNVAAAYYGFEDLRCYSGGTELSALNPRTAATLRRIGIEVEPTGGEAERGDPRVANPIHRIRWGTPDSSTGRTLEISAFSKKYDDPSNPGSGFAAILVCAEADGACPIVKGADLRISAPFMDPKIYDDTIYESEKYDERRDDLGRMVLAAMMLARHKLDSSGGR